MASTIETVAQTIAVGGVGGCTLTPIEQDPDTGLYVRELRVFGMLDDGTLGPQMLTVRISGVSADKVQMQTPQFKF